MGWSSGNDRRPHINLLSENKTYQYFRIVELCIGTCHLSEASCVVASRVRVVVYSNYLLSEASCVVASRVRVVVYSNYLPAAL
jgi:hypothetical protein